MASFLRRKLSQVRTNTASSVAVKKTKDATSNENWGPSGTQMKELAEMTNNVDDLAEIMDTLEGRLVRGATKGEKTDASASGGEETANNITGISWRKVYKTVILLEYLAKNGNPAVVSRIQHGKMNYLLENVKDKFVFIDPVTLLDEGSKVPTQGDE